ncbi:Secreted subtilisin-like serine protease sub11 [Gamsiella multidivaricata]|nr:Secreted subtilisin-like serine protease sub11 [Gamsiella multidivaricata]
MKYSGLLIVACVALFASSDAAPLLKSNSGKPIPDSYIVVLKEGHKVSDFVPKFEAIAKRQNGRGRKSTIGRKYNSIQGFSATVNSAALKELLAADEVSYVEQDQIVTINALTQNNPPSWGLPRVSMRQNNRGAPYYYQDQAGAGVTAYVIDTGINTAHTEFGGRATMGANFVSGSANTDENGHGTHVSGTIGGATYGVAKKVKLVGVKVLNAQGSGSYSGIVAGMDWVAQRAAGSKAVVNMSLGGGKSQALDDAVTRLYNAGVPVIIAAGNDANADACNGSPSGAQGSFTIAASDINDRIATFSSWGHSDSSLTSAQSVYNKLLQTSTSNVIQGSLRGSPNRLVFNSAV